MGTMLHEVLAVEKTKTEAANGLLSETAGKFGKEHFFTGYVKTLRMLNDSPENTATEAAAREERALVTNVHDTLQYTLDIWAQAEDVIFAKNLTNTTAFADVMLDGKAVMSHVPVDELMGLEVRLDKIRGVLKVMPTLDASKDWVTDTSRGNYVWTGKIAHSASKTEKVTTPVVLYDATDKHPAQVKEATKDVVVGTFERKEWSGAVTTIQKANALKRIDDLIAAVKAARMRANKTDVVSGKIGASIVALIMEPLQQK